uniref:Anthocyanin 3'-O-beta-glucosyltransferase n=1 Tax=Aegilops tauschii TaxID=37682 RepID=R7WDF5_AEGTA
MAVQEEALHILFFPFLASGHLIPTADMAALFAGRGVRCTILTTPVHAAIIRSAVDRANDAFTGTGCPAIDIAVVPFPDVGLPPGVENGTALTSQDDRDKLFHAAQLLRESFDRFLADHRTDAVVSDSFFHWSVDAAAERGVPRIAFLGSSMFARACSDSMMRHNPLENAPDDPDALVLLPGLPHRVELRRSQMMDPAKMTWQWEFFKSVNAADQRSFGEVFNSFHDLEPDYVEHFQKTLGRRVWLVGPVALASKDMAVRGTDVPSPDAGSCLRWLDAKPSGSVVYVSFGTLTKFAPAEMHQLARALDLSGLHFAWFNNEKLVVELLKVGVSIGAKDYASGIQAHEVIAGEVIAESIQRLMEGDDIQKKAKDLGLKARSAVEKGGSSYDDVGRLMDVLTARRSSVKIGEDIQAS